MKKLLLQHKFIALGGILIFLLFVLFAASSTYKEATGGSISLVIPYASSQVFLDNKKELTTLTPNEEITFSGLTAGVHSVLVHRPGFLPWAKDFFLAEKTSVVATPFLLPIEIIFDETTDTNGIYGIYNKLFKEKETHKTSPSQNISIDVAGNTITATWIGESSVPYFFCTNEVCDTKQNVFSHKVMPIRYAEFYPNREDLILFAVGEGIYIIEIDKRGTQNFQPLYIGKSPDFRFDIDSNTMIVRDDGKFLSLVL